MHHVEPRKGFQLLLVPSNEKRQRRPIHLHLCRNVRDRVRDQKVSPQYVRRVNTSISRSVRTPETGTRFELFRLLSHGRTRRPINVNIQTDVFRLARRDGVRTNGVWRLIRSSPHSPHAPRLPPPPHPTPPASPPEGAGSAPRKRGLLIRAGKTQVFATQTKCVKGQRRSPAEAVAEAGFPSPAAPAGTRVKTGGRPFLFQHSSSSTPPFFPRFC